MITQSVSMKVEAAAGISCNNQRRHTDNSYLRRFDLQAVPLILIGRFAATIVEFGVEFAQSDGRTQPIIVKVHAIPKQAPMTFGNMTLLDSAYLDLPDQELSIESVELVRHNFMNALESDLVIEIFSPNGQTDDNIFFLGSNSRGETAPSYIAAADCGEPEPTTYASLGYPQVHIVMAVDGFYWPPPTQAVNRTWGEIKAQHR